MTDAARKLPEPEAPAWARELLAELRELRAELARSEPRKPARPKTRPKTKASPAALDRARRKALEAVRGRSTG